MECCDITKADEDLRVALQFDHSRSKLSKRVAPEPPLRQMMPLIASSKKASLRSFALSASDPERWPCLA